MEKLKVPVTGTQSFGVRVGDGYRVRSEGECRGVCIDLQGVTAVLDFFPFDMNSSDVVLGMAWLETLGETMIDWKNQVMLFKNKGKTVTLCGDPTLSKTLVSLKAMLKTIQKEGHGYLVEFGSLQKQTESEKDMDSRLCEVLEQFQSVFKPLAGLPPIRNHEHAIRLLPNAQPPNIRPYRYPYYQKNEIERIVREMLASGIIKPSVSHFFSRSVTS